ncbi:RNA chaperone Hfq [Trinickia sp. EG282A]|uniref:RNA chaperone Hfq n=1 Tax=Trinickia sp. EG282A TaxID=3237013 RepID=UPI0034D33A0C
MPNPSESHPQNDFMNAARKERKRVEIYLVNGIRLTGCIESFDQYLVMLRTPVGLQGIYKRAISTIQLDTGTRPGPRGPRPGGHGERERHGPREGSGPYRESREPREPREPREAHGAPTPSHSDRTTNEGPVVVTRRRRPFSTAPHNGEHGNNGGDSSNNE